MRSSCFVFVPSRGISNLNVFFAKDKTPLAMFSSPPGAYLISILQGVSIKYCLCVFVPSRGISNLNPVFYIALEPRLPNVVCGGNRKPCTISLYNQLLLSATPYFQGIGAKWHINYEFCMLIRPIPISYSSPLYLVHLHTCGAKCSCRFL